MMINLIEASRGIRKPALRLYIMHLVELSERSSAIMMVHKARKNGLPFWNRNRSQSQDRIVVAFEAYEQLSKVTVRPMTAISPIHDMHEDICNIADRKRIAMIILPFHKYQRVDGVLESVSLAFETVNQRVLKHVCCSWASWSTGANWVSSPSWHLSTDKASMLESLSMDIIFIIIFIF